MPATLEFQSALNELADKWVPACGGHELPFIVRGFRLQYMFNPATRQHAYYNLDTDTIISNEEYLAICGL